MDAVRDCVAAWRAFIEPNKSIWQRTENVVTDRYALGVEAYIQKHLNVSLQRKGYRPVDYSTGSDITVMRMLLGHDYVKFFYTQSFEIDSQDAQNLALMARPRPAVAENTYEFPVILNESNSNFYAVIPQALEFDDSLPRGVEDLDPERFDVVIAFTITDEEEIANRIVAHQILLRFSGPFSSIDPDYADLEREANTYILAPEASLPQLRCVVCCAVLPCDHSQ